MASFCTIFDCNRHEKEALNANENNNRRVADNNVANDKIANNKKADNKVTNNNNNQKKVMTRTVMGIIQQNKKNQVIWKRSLFLIKFCQPPWL